MMVLERPGHKRWAGGRISIAFSVGMVILALLAAGTQVRAVRLDRDDHTLDDGHCCPRRPGRLEQSCQYSCIHTHNCRQNKLQLRPVACWGSHSQHNVISPGKLLQTTPRDESWAWMKQRVHHLIRHLMQVRSHPQRAQRTPRRRRPRCLLDASRLPSPAQAKPAQPQNL